VTMPPCGTLELGNAKYQILRRKNGSCDIQFLPLQDGHSE